MELTPRALKAIQQAEDEARSLGHACTGSQHLLLGLFLLGSGVHFHVLCKYGFTEKSLRQGIVALRQVWESTQIVAGFALGSSAAQALERARQEGAAMSHTYTGTEQILLGLLSEESGGAAGLFASNSIDVASARRAILDECAQV